MSPRRGWFACISVLGLMATPAFADAATAGGSGCIWSETPPAPPSAGAVIWSPAVAQYAPNTIILAPDDPWPDVLGECLMTIEGPTLVTVSPGGALVIKGLSAEPPFGEVIAAWGAVSATSSSPNINLLPNGDNSEITGIQVLRPSEMVAQYGSCRACLFDGLTITIPVPNENVAFFGDLSGSSFRKSTVNSTTGLRFDGSDFTGATLKGNYYGASFGSVIVDGAVFDGTDLSNATLDHLRYSSAPPSFISPVLGQGTAITNTNLLDASFTGVQSSGESVSLSGSQLSLATAAELLVGARLVGVQWSGATIIAAPNDRRVLSGANLQGLNLTGLTIRGERVDLTGAKLDGATLTDAVLELAQLSGASLTGITAAGASFNGADLSANDTQPGANLSGKNTNLKGAHFVNSDLSNASFVGADLSGADFTGARAVQTDFSGVNAAGTVFSAAHIYGDGQAFDSATDLSNADFTYAVLAADATQSGGFDFTNATLAGAHFDNAVCVSCNFAEATLTGATFVSAYLPGVVLDGATLSGVAFDRAWLYCGDLNDDTCITPPATTPAWPMNLGTDETYGPVPFTSTQLAHASLDAVLSCPDGQPPDANQGCANHLLPVLGQEPPIPAPCSASAHGSCPVATTTLGVTTMPNVATSIVNVVPPTWSSTLTGGGAWYVAFADNTIRRYDRGVWSIVAGTAGAVCDDTGPSICGDGGPATRATFGFIKTLAVGMDGSLYVADFANIRRIAPNGIIDSVIPGAFNSLMVVDTHGRILFNGEASLQQWSPDGGMSTVVAGLGDIRGMAVGADGDIYLSQWNPDVILQVDPRNGSLTTVVGTGTAGYNGNSDMNGNLLPGTEVQVSRPNGLAVGLDGNLVIADALNNLIRAYVPSTGFVTDPIIGALDANGNPIGGFNGDGLWGTETQIQGPLGLALTREGSIAFLDDGNGRERVSAPSPAGDQVIHRRQVLLSCRQDLRWKCHPVSARHVSLALDALQPVSEDPDVTASRTRVAQVTLSHRRVVYAQGQRLRSEPGRLRLRLAEQRPLLPGVYDLAIKRQNGTVDHERLVLRPDLRPQRNGAPGDSTPSDRRATSCRDGCGGG